MPNIAYPNAIVAGDVPLASVVSNNFTAILAVVNSSGLDSVNYKVSGIGSANIATNAILSQHISNSQIVAAHISDSQIDHSKMLFNSASDGVRAIQIAASDSMKAYGLEMVRVSGAHTLDSDAATAQITAYWSNGVDGGARTWTETPIMMGNPALQITDGSFPPTYFYLYTVNSTAAIITASFSATQDGVFTWHLAAIGAPTG